MPPCILTLEILKSGNLCDLDSVYTYPIQYIPTQCIPFHPPGIPLLPSYPNSTHPSGLSPNQLYSFLNQPKGNPECGNCSLYCYLMFNCVNLISPTRLQRGHELFLTMFQILQRTFTNKHFKYSFNLGAGEDVFIQKVATIQFPLNLNYCLKFSLLKTWGKDHYKFLFFK